MTRADYDEICALLAVAEDVAQDFWLDKPGATAEAMVDAKVAVRERLVKLIDWNKS
jgi:hypothetical protein